jgi:hypothetical protein
MLIAAASDIDWQAIFNPGVMVFLIGGLIAIVAIVSTVWLKVVAERERAQLKADMIERGFSVDDIVRVVEAGNENAPAAGRSKSPKPGAGASRDAETVVSRR